MPKTAIGTSIATGRPWRRALLWLFFLGPFFFVSYGFSNWLAGQRDAVGSIVFDWEYRVPFLPWSILPYWLIDLFYGLSLLLPRNRFELDAHAKRLLTAQLISCFCFIVYPLRFSFERPETTGFPGWLFDVLLGFDKPFNQAPSLHISLLVILWTLYAQYLTWIWLWLLRSIALMIGLSVLTTYQHHFIDIPTGVLSGCIAVMLFPLAPQATVMQLDPLRFRIAGLYLASALLLAALAFISRGAWLWLLWPSCSLAVVAVIYWRGDASLFRNYSGRIEDAVAVLLAPYLIGAWLNSRLWTLKSPDAGNVQANLWLSRRPSAAEIRFLDAQGLVDCCPELIVDAGQVPVYSVAMLDLLVPEPQQIELGVEAIEAASKHGKTLVFCALGYSRSAIIVSAWLFAYGFAESIEAAVETVRRARPKLVLSARHIAQLKAWHQWRSESSVDATFAVRGRVRRGLHCISRKK